MSSRRNFLQTVSTVIVTSPFTVAIATAEEETCEFHIVRLAQAMKAIHGGEWRVNINHNSKMAAVVKI